MLTAYDAATVGYDLDGSTLCRRCAVNATNAIYVWKVDARMEGWACDSRGLDPLSRFCLEDTMIERGYEYARDAYLDDLEPLLSKMSDPLRLAVEKRAAFRYQESERCEECGLVLVPARFDPLERLR